jgi:hypothetical protein
MVAMATCAAGNAALAVHGRLVRQGKALDVAKAPLVAVGRRCHEPSEKTVEIDLRLPAALTAHHLDETVVAISGTPGLVTLGEAREPQTAGRSYDPARDGWGRVLAWVSPTDRGEQATLPDRGWVKFNALARNGPIEVDLDLDFGNLGRIAGRVRVEDTEERVCRVPTAPAPH